MKWTIRIELQPDGNPPITGAHYLLQVRAELLNGTLLATSMARDSIDQKAAKTRSSCHQA
jgi:hypothetical protein